MQYLILFFELLALIFVGYRLYLMFVQAEKNHKREKDKQTIELMHNYLREFREERIWLANPANEAAISDPSNLSPADVSNLEQVLGFLERVAVGVRYDVYNADIVRTTSRRYITLTYVSCLPYIYWRRHEALNDSVFAELSWLVQLLNGQPVDVHWQDS